MKSAQKWLLATIALFLTTQAQAQVFDALKLEMEKGCPAIWEDLGLPINAGPLPSNVWQGNTADLTAFTTQYIQNYAVTQAEADQVAATPSAVASVCGSFRMALLDTLNASNSLDATVAAANASSPDALTIQAGAPAGALVVASDGDIGVGTGAPGQLAFGEEASIHVLRNDGNASLLIEETGGPTAARGMLELKNNGGPYVTLKNTATNEDWFMSFENASPGRFIISDGVNDGPELVLTKEGDLTTQGAVTAKDINVLAGGIPFTGNVYADVIVQDSAAPTDIAMISLISGATANSQLTFGSETEQFGGQVIYNNASQEMNFNVGGSRKLAIDQGGLTTSGVDINSATSGGHAELLMTTGAQSWKLRSHSGSNLVFVNNTSNTSPMKMSSAAQTDLLQIGFDSSGVASTDSINMGGDLTIQGTLTTSGTTCGGGCDAVFTPEYKLPTIEDHANAMWANKYLPNVGPTIENEPINVPDKLGRMLNELETAHIYIASLNEQLNTEAKKSKQEIDRLSSVIGKLEERLNELEK